MVRCVVVGILCVLACSAYADNDAHRATALFDRAQVLRKEGRLVEACEEFEASFALDPAIGTELNVADCRERQGKVDEAWKLFDHAARTDKRADRAKYARARADSISKVDKKPDNTDDSAVAADRSTDVELQADPADDEQQSPRDGGRPANESARSRTGWRVVFFSSVAVAVVGAGLVVYGRHQITDAEQQLCDGNGYPPDTRADICTSQPTGPMLTPAQLQTINAQGHTGRNLMIAGELTAVIGGGLAILGLYEGYFASDAKSSRSMAIAPMFSRAGGGLTVSGAW